MINSVNHAFGKTGHIGKHFINKTEERRAFYGELLKQLRSNVHLSKRKSALNKLAKSGIHLSQDEGYLILSKDNDYVSSELIDQILIRSNDDEVLKQRKNAKAQLLTGLLEPKAIDEQSEFLKFALNKDLISAISNYLGIIPILSYVDVWYSKSTPNLSDSQLYHCDYGESKQVKVFVYATDVTKDSGPLVVIDAKRSAEVRKKLKYNFGAKLTDDIILSLVKDEDQVSITGEAGSMALVDTSRCFHYGSRVNAESLPRKVAIFQYVTPASFTLPVFSKELTPFRHLNADKFNELEQLVLGIYR